MARLVLSMNNQVLAEYNMSKERYTIGRLPDNDVRIDNPAVSGHHSLVINILNDSFLEDLNSTNGTYVNGKLVKKHALQHGDVITIGHHQLRFVDEQVEPTSPDDFEKTMIIRPGAQAGAPSQRRVEEAVARAEAVAPPPMRAAAGGARPAPVRTRRRSRVRSPAKSPRCRARSCRCCPACSPARSSSSRRRSRRSAAPACRSPP